MGRAVAIVVAAMLLNACETTPWRDPPEDRSPNYQLGFGDGCATASTETAGAPRYPRRNRVLYSDNRDYRTGWLSGHAQCRSPGPASVFIRRN